MKPILTAVLCVFSSIAAAGNLHPSLQKDVEAVRKFFTVTNVAVQQGHAMVKVMCNKETPIVIIGDNGAGSWMPMSGDDSLSMPEDVKQTCETMALVKSMGMPGMNQQMQAMMMQHQQAMASSEPAQPTPSSQAPTVQSSFNTPEFKQQLSDDVEATQNRASASITDKQKDYWAIRINCHSGKRMDLFFDFGDGYLYEHQTERSGNAYEGPVSSLAWGLCSS